jgi:hypothetical protein
MSVSPEFHMHMEHLQGLSDLIEQFRAGGIINAKENVVVQIDKSIIESRFDLWHLIEPTSGAVLKPFLMNSPSFCINDVSTMTFCATLNPGLEWKACADKLSRIFNFVDSFGVTRLAPNCQTMNPKL